MGREYFMFYMEANIVCILILALLLFNDKLHSTRQEKQIWFNRTIVAHILYFLSDIGWAAVLSGQLLRTRALVILFNLLNYILLGLIAYEWFIYMAASEDMPFRKSRKKRHLCLIPLLVSVAAITIAYAADPLFWVGRNGELNDLYYPMFVAAPVFYLLCAFIFSMVNARRTETAEQKHLYLLIGIYPLAVLVFGLIQTFSLNAPLFCFGCTIMMVFFYIQNMQTQVSVDALTRLNNRGQINRYMGQVRFRENIDVYAMMIDINGFKEINDTFGHAEGDRALVLAAGALRRVTEKLKAQIFIGRYGGDEFAVFLQTTEGDELAEKLAEEIRAAFLEAQVENNLPYEMKVSVGCDKLRDKDDTLEAALARADEKLYANKRR